MAEPAQEAGTAGRDPFLAPRDRGEVEVCELMREFLLEKSPPAEVFRQSTEGGYALIVPRSRGVRMVTVPGAHEADFLWHGNSGTTADALASFVTTALGRSQADHLRLPLLSRLEVGRLEAQLSRALPRWRFDSALATIAPYSTRKRSQPGILRKAVQRTQRDGVELDFPAQLPQEEIRALHVNVWGPNRDTSFFGMLAELHRAGRAEVAVARTRSGELVAAQVDLLGERIRHCYYVLSDTTTAPGCGTALLGLHWRRYMESETQHFYSFGRGAERYKYQFAQRYQEWFELRGFLAPCPTGDPRKESRR